MSAFLSVDTAPEGITVTEPFVHPATPAYPHSFTDTEGQTKYQLPPYGEDATLEDSQEEESVTDAGQIITWHAESMEVRIVRAPGNTSTGEIQRTFTSTNFVGGTQTTENFTLTIPENGNQSNIVFCSAVVPATVVPGQPTSAGTAITSLPAELRDTKGPGDADDHVIERMQAEPRQNQGETNQGFWLRRNAYFQQQVPDRSVAYIEPHRAANNRPDMPRLVARVPGGAQGLRVRWRLEVEYLRGNGYRAGYVEDFTRPEDKVRIPAASQAGAPVFTAEMAANQEWRMFETQDWLDEIQQRGFFGGTGKLYLWPPGQQEPPTEPIITFRIGGRNPDQQLARQFIDQSAGAQYWYAYAIARHETFGRVRVNGEPRFYNQFYTEYQGRLIGDASVDMGWAAWAKGWPLYNLDRNRRRDRTRYQNGPGGYGMYQLTWGPKHPNNVQGTGADAFIPRRMIWNWQDNANGAIIELQEKMAASEALRNGLQAAYPQWPAMPNAGNLSALEAIIVTFYNGKEQLPRRRIGAASQKTPWTAVRTGPTRTWQFHQNSKRYVESVNTRIDNTTP